MANDLGKLIAFLENPENHYIIEEAEARILAAIDQSQIRTPNNRDDRDVLVYPTSRLIVEKIGVPRLREYQAEAESKAVNKNLGSEDSKFIMTLARSSFRWRLESLGTPIERAELPENLRKYEFRMGFENFLEVAPSFRSPEWKLVNRMVQNGWVYISKSELARLVSGKFKQVILDSFLDVPELPSRLTEAVQRIETEIRGKIRKSSPIEITETITTAFPPCIKMMHNDSVRGKNLPHEARFALASFLLRIGMDVEEVVAIFKAAPDFARASAGYQVRHIASKSGGKGYDPPGCRKMQTFGLCPVYVGEIFDPLCEYVLHPLGFYETRAWESTKGITNHSWYASKRKRKQKLK
jgi:DNA primase large subunit